MRTLPSVRRSATSRPRKPVGNFAKKDFHSKSATPRARVSAANMANAAPSRFANCPARPIVPPTSSSSEAARLARAPLGPPMIQSPGRPEFLFSCPCCECRRWVLAGLKLRNRNFREKVRLDFVNLKNINACEDRQEKVIEKTILRVLRARTFLHSLGHSLSICFVLASYNVCSTPKADIRFQHNIRRDGPKAAVSSCSIYGVTSLGRLSA